MWLHTTPLANVASIEREGLRPVSHLSLVPELVLVGEFTQGHHQTCECPTYHLAVYEVDVTGLQTDEGWDPNRPHLAVYEHVPTVRLRRVPDPAGVGPCKL